MRELLGFLDKVPKFLKEGPWTLVAHFVIATFAGLLVYTASLAYSNYRTISEMDFLTLEEPSWLGLYRLFFGLYGVAVVALMVRSAGHLPLATYTITSWNLMSLRLISMYFSGVSKIAEFLALVTRFPALIGCTITVTIWWIVLVPLIHHLLETPKKRKGFWDFNTSFILLNVHLLNLPIIGVEFLAAGKPLFLYDLWIGLAVAFVYLLFYLHILDANGLHFYIVLSPRTVFCVVSYLLIFGFYYFFFRFWNGLVVVSELAEKLEGLI